MRKFLINLLLFSAICIIALAAFELYMLRVPNRYSYKREYIEKHLDDLEVLLLGNCYIEDGLIPDSLGPHTFNSAISGRELAYDADLAERYVPRMKHLKLLVAPITYRTFGFGRQKPNPQDLKVHGGYESTFKCMNYKYLGCRVDGFWYWSEVLNSELNYKSRIRMTYAQQIETDSLGFVRLLDANRGEGWQRWDLPKFYDTSIPVDQEELDKMKRQYVVIAEAARKSGCRLVLLSTPMYQTYQQYMNPRVEQEMIDLVSWLQESYPEVEYRNYTHDRRFVFTDFHDASHLSEFGSVKFSRIFRDEVVGR